MSKHAEIIYEPGSKSVVSYETDDELKAALKEQHSRAISGNTGGPGGAPAERISKVVLYDKHPGDDNGGVVSAANVGTLVSEMTQSDGTLNANQLISALREEMSPTYPQDQGAHNSMYKMTGTEMDMGFLDDSSGGA